MHPFFPSLPNQIQTRGGSGFAHQQVMLPNPHWFPCAQHNPLGLNNSQQIPSQLNTPSHQFQGPPRAALNTQNMNHMHGNNTVMPNQPHMMPSSCFPSCPNPNVVSLMAQKGLLGVHPQHGHLGPQHQIQYQNQIGSFQSNGQFCNLPQNLNQIGLPQLGGLFTLHGQMQSVNQVAPLQPCGQFWLQNMPTDSNQINGLLHGQFCSQNSMLPVNQIVSQQCLPHPLGMTQVRPFNGPPSSDRLVAGPGSQNPCSMPNSQLQSGALQQDQVGHIKDGGNDNSAVGLGNYAGKKFTRNPHGFGKRDRPNMRFQKSQFHHLSDAKGNLRPFNHNFGKGQQNGRDRKPQPAKFGNLAPGECRRPRPVNYTEQEIKQWREARKKNFPTTANVEKKSESDRNYEAVDEDAKICRQQLREILAKQVELGVEVAELPPKYLCEPENQICKKEDDKKEEDVEGQFRKKYNKRGRDGWEKMEVDKKEKDVEGQFRKKYNKRGRGGWEKRENDKKEKDVEGQFRKKYNKRGRGGWEKRHAKKRKFGSDNPPVPAPIERKPTLLQKLLSSDIKRDKSRLLQVFRFMTVNSFFEHWPEKPLEFLLVKAKDAGCMDDCGKEKSLDGVNGAAFGDGTNIMIEEVESQNDPSVADEAEDGASDSNRSNYSDDQEEEEMLEQDYPTEQVYKLEEEGEITD